MTDATQSVVIERALDAPLARVWEAWTDPAQFAAWYGPPGARIPVSQLDLAVGGKRLVCMEMDTPDGSMQMWFAGEVREIVEHARFVYTESMSDEDGNIKTPEEMGMPAGHPTVTVVTVVFEDLGDQTKIVMTHEGVPADSPGAMGWNMAIDKLATHVEAAA